MSLDTQDTRHIQSHLYGNIIAFHCHCPVPIYATIFSRTFAIACSLVVRVTNWEVRLSVWLVSGYANAFVLNETQTNQRTRISVTQSSSSLLLE